MRRLVAPVVALAVAACALTGAGASARASHPDALRVTSPFMRDAQGRVLILHGVNAVWKLRPYAPPNTAEGFTARDAAFLASNGFDVVRLGVLFAGVLPKEGVIDRDSLERIDRVD